MSIASTLLAHKQLFLAIAALTMVAVYMIPFDAIPEVFAARGGGGGGGDGGGGSGGGGGGGGHFGGGSGSGSGGGGSGSGGGGGGGGCFPYCHVKP